MDELTESMSNLKMDVAAVPVDESMLNEVLNLMRHQSLNSLSVGELVSHLQAVHIQKHSTDGGGRIYSGQTPAVSATPASMRAEVPTPGSGMLFSPQFHFKTPSKPLVFGNDTDLNNAPASSESTAAMHLSGNSPTIPQEMFAHGSTGPFSSVSSSSTTAAAPESFIPVPLAHGPAMQTQHAAFSTGMTSTARAQGRENTDNTNAAQRKKGARMRKNTPAKSTAGISPIKAPIFAFPPSPPEQSAFQAGVGSGPTSSTQGIFSGGVFWGQNSINTTQAAIAPSIRPDSVPYAWMPEPVPVRNQSSPAPPPAPITPQSAHMDLTDNSSDLSPGDLNNIETTPLPSRFMNGFVGSFPFGSTAEATPSPMPIATPGTAQMSSPVAEPAANYMSMPLPENPLFNIGQQTKSSKSAKSKSKKSSPARARKGPNVIEQDVPLENLSSYQTDSGISAEFEASLHASDSAPEWWNKPESMARKVESDGPNGPPQPPFPSAAPRSLGAQPTSPRKDSSTTQDSKLHLAELYRKQGREMYNTEKYEQAHDAFTKALTVAPANWPLAPTVLGNRAAALVMINRYIEACDDCQEALKLDQSLVKLNIRRARALLRLGHFSAVEEACTRVLESTSAPAPIHIHISSDQEVDAAKIEARKCLKDLQHIRILLSRLNSAECLQEFENVLKITEEILDSCPQFRVAQVARANAMNKLQRWTTAKEYIEEIICTVHDTVLRLHSHCTHTTSESFLPKLTQAKLAWTDGGRGVVKMNKDDVMRAVMIMGGDLAAVYMVSLKNVVVSRSCCGDVMAKTLWIMVRIKELLVQYGGNNGLGTQSSGWDWAWADTELSRLQSIIDAKNRADQYFKEANFTAAIQSYGDAMKADISAYRWSAVLHSNRAAAYMSLGMFQEAVNDCNSSASRDPGYTRAYLRRARALRALTKWAEAIRDYRKYLSSLEGGLPSDYSEIETELEDALKLQAKHIRAEQMRQQSDRFANESGFKFKSKPHFFDSDDDDYAFVSWLPFFTSFYQYLCFLNLFLLCINSISTRSPVPRAGSSKINPSRSLPVLGMATVEVMQVQVVAAALSQRAISAAGEIRMMTLKQRRSPKKDLTTTKRSGLSRPRRKSRSRKHTGPSPSNSTQTKTRIPVPKLHLKRLG